MSLLIDLPQYQRPQRLGALRIMAIIPNPRGIELHFENQRYVPIQVSLFWIAEHMPVVGGYFIVKDDGRDGFMLAADFDAQCTALGGEV